MIDLNTGFIQKPEDGLGYSRAFCASIGQLEHLDRDTKIRVWYAGEYRTGHVETRIAGGCYWVGLERGIGRIDRLIVNCGNFGGRVHD